MTKKILVADDSSTIQKVISITLSEEPFDIDECLNITDLFEYIEEEDYNLILLDINLSEDKNGYELTKEILKKSPNSKIMLLLGTFDTVSESLFEESGAHEKMIKPFDSKKFVQNCRSLIGDLDEEYEEDEYEEELEGEDEEEDEEYEYVDEDSEEDSSEEYEYEDDEYEGENLSEKESKESHDNWVVKGSNKSIESNNDASMTISRLEENAQKLKLEKELDDWGGDFPSIIRGKETSSKEVVPLPPPINQLDVLRGSDNNEDMESDLFPDDDDLGYPGEKRKEELERLDIADPSQKFLSADELMDQGDDEEEDMTDPSYNLPENFNKELEDKVDADTSPDDFWAVDSGDKEKVSEKEEIPSSKFSFNGEGVKEEKSQQVTDEKYSQNISIDELRPIIEEIVKKYCENTITKVAWEVIPDLAENLIKEELKEISQKIE